MRSQEYRVLKYISNNPDVTLHLETISELILNKFEANQVLFNLLQEEFITEKKGKIEITVSGIAYLKSIE